MKKYLLIAATLAILPTLVFAQGAGPQAGDREFTLSGTGSSDKDFDNSNFGISADIGWYRTDRFVWGIRQSLNYADVEGENLSDDFFNGSTRGYLDYHFGQGAARPFVGANLGLIYGDGVEDTGVGGSTTPWRIRSFWRVPSISSFSIAPTMLKITLTTVPGNMFSAWAFTSEVSER